MSTLVPVSQKMPARELATILDKNQDETDSLSVGLFDWGVDLLQRVVRHHKVEVPDEESFKQVLVKKTDAFRQLIWDPFSNRPMRDIVFDGERAWDAKIYADCQECCIVSPFDGQVMPENPKEHVFGNGVSHWVDSYMPAVPEEESESPMLVLAKFPQCVDVKRFVYKRVAQGVVAEESLKAVRSDLEEGLQRMKRAISQMRCEAEAALKEAEEGLQNSDELLVSRIESVEKIYQETLSDFTKQKEWRDRIFQEKIAKLETEMKIRDETDRSAIENLQKQKEALVAERESEWANYSKQFNAVDQARIQAIQSINAQIRSGCDQWNREAKAKADQHRANVSNLSAEISQEREKARQLEQELAGARAYANWQADRVALSRNNIAHLRNSLNGLRDDLANLPRRSGTRICGINF